MIIILPNCSFRPGNCTRGCYCSAFEKAGGEGELCITWSVEAEDLGLFFRSKEA